MFQFFFVSLVLLDRGRNSSSDYRSIALSAGCTKGCQRALHHGGSSKQRVQDLEAIVRQLKEGCAGNPASQPSRSLVTHINSRSLPPAATRRDVGQCRRLLLPRRWLCRWRMRCLVRPIRPLPTARCSSAGTMVSPS